MAVRDFDGVDDIIRLTPPAWWAAGAVTIVAVVKRDTPSVAWEGIFSIGSGSGTPALVLEFGSDVGTDGIEYVPHSTAHHHERSYAGWESSGWQLVVVSIPASAGTVRWHGFNGTTWFHGNEGTTTGGATPVDWTGMDLRFGCYNTSFNFFNGKMAVIALRIGTAMSDGEVEALGAGTKEAWQSAGMTHLWELGQDNVATAVTDYIGACDEIGITGTSVVTGDDPPSSIYDLTSVPHPPDEAAPPAATVVRPTRANTPHFRWPFERTSAGSVAVAEQGSASHIDTQIHTVVATPVGFRPERPDFGWPFPEFATLPLDLATLAAAIGNFVPDADVRITEWADAASQAVRHIRIEERV